MKGFRILILLFIVFTSYVASANATIQETYSESIEDYVIEYKKIEHEDPFKAIDLIKEALKVGGEDLPLQEISSLHNKIGNVYLDLHMYPLAMSSYYESMKYANEANDEGGSAYCFCDIGNVYFALGNYDLPKEYYNQAIEVFKKKNDEFGISVASINLGMVALMQKEYSAALSYYQEALAIRQKVGDLGLEAHTYSYISEVFRERGYLEKAVEYLLKSRDLYARNREPLKVAEMNYKLGEAYTIYDQYNEALDYFEKAYNLFNLKKDYQYAIRSAVRVGETYLSLGDYNKALEYGRIAEKMSDKDKSVAREKLEVTQLISDVFSAQNNFEQAYRYQRVHKKLQANFDRSDNQQEFSKLLYSISAYKEAQENERLKNSISSQNDRFRFMLVLVILLIVIVGGWVYWARQKRRQERILMLKQKEIRELEMYKKEQENERLNRELDFRNNELASKAITLVKTTEFVDEVLKDLNQLSVPRAHQKDLTSIIDKLRNFKKEDGWREFEVRFEKVHKNFYEKLEEKYPTLTPNERKLCAFLRLNMTTKEISALTYKSAKSIDVARSRLRKKMDLPREENLVNYLAQF